MERLNVVFYLDTIEFRGVWEQGISENNLNVNDKWYRWIDRWSEVAPKNEDKTMESNQTIEGIRIVLFKEKETN